MKKRLALLLCLLVFLTVFSGCGTAALKTEPDPPASPEQREAVSPSPSPSPTPTPAPTPDPEEEARQQRLKEAQDGFVWEDGYLYAIDEEGNLKTDCWIGVLYFGRDGRYTSGSKKLDRLVADVISENTKDSMTRMEKLEAMYDYTRDNIQYVGYGNHEMTYQPAHGKDGWMVEIATEALEEGHGNCYYFAAQFCALARGLGYQAYAVGGVFSAMEDPHGWVVILDEDGNQWLCDPEMEYKLHYWVEELNGGTPAGTGRRNRHCLRTGEGSLCRRTEGSGRAGKSGLCQIRNGQHQTRHPGHRFNDPGDSGPVTGGQPRGITKRSCSKMENFAQLHFYGQIHKNSSRIRILSENYRNFTQSTL